MEETGGIEPERLASRTGADFQNRPEPMNSNHQQRQRQYRLRLAAKRAPEVDRVDAALAAATICYIDAVSDGFTTTSAEPQTKLLMRATFSLLIAEGYDRVEALAVLRRLLTHQGRRDLGDLTELSRIRARMQRA
ncbi:hypothetical protein [Arvimicrobium flavum]|uniref:hypothetical protein n=1 Tax=Arvimicrobium flavum TaxID=3393320 RepID=UPI00237BEE3F|nr:hypothetical protein [Mesorhizobium shangrilense]